MVTIKVIRDYIDRETKELAKADSIIEVTPERATELIAGKKAIEETRSYSGGRGRRTDTWTETPDPTEQNL